MHSDWGDRNTFQWLGHIWIYFADHVAKKINCTILNLFREPFYVPPLATGSSLKWTSLHDQISVMLPPSGDRATAVASMIGFISYSEPLIYDTCGSKKAIRCSSRLRWSPKSFNTQLRVVIFYYNIDFVEGIPALLIHPHAVVRIPSLTLTKSKEPFTTCIIIKLWYDHEHSRLLHAPATTEPNRCCFHTKHA